MMKKLIYVFAIAFFLMSCGNKTGTQVSSSWHDSESDFNSSSYSKLAVIVLDKNEGERRQAEENLASLFGSKGVPSYTIITEDLSSANQEQVESELVNAGCDAAMIVELSNVESTQSKRTPRVSLDPNLYYNFGGHFNAGVGLNVYSGYSGPGKEYDVESMIYELPKGNLVWSTITATSNPDSFSDMLKQVKSKVSKQLDDDGII